MHRFRFPGLGQAGPETGQDDHRSLLLRQGGIEIVLTSALTPGHPAADYVTRHGDGVAEHRLRDRGRRRGVRGGGRPGRNPGLEKPRPPPRDGTRGGHRRRLGFGDVAAPASSAQRRPLSIPARRHGLIVADPRARGRQLLHTVDHAAICLPGGRAELDGRLLPRQVFGFAQIFEEFIEVGDQAMDSKVVQSPPARSPSP